jgi:hypothetical protein
MEQAQAGRGPRDPVRLFSTLAVQAAVEPLLPLFAEAETVRVDAVFDPTALLLSTPSRTSSRR